MGSDEDLARILTGRLVADPEESVDRLIEEFDSVSVISLSLTLRMLCERQAGDSGQRVELVMALVDAIEDAEDAEELSDAEGMAAATAFRTALRDDELMVRTGAVEGLGIVGDSRDIDPLYRLAVDPEEDSLVREDSLHSLYLIDPHGLVLALRQGLFAARVDAGFDAGIGAVVRALRAALIDPSLALTVEEMKPLLGSPDEGWLLTYISETLRLLGPTTPEAGLATMCTEIAKLASYDTSPEIETCVNAVIQCL